MPKISDDTIEMIVQAPWVVLIGGMLFFGALLLWLTPVFIIGAIIYSLIHWLIHLFIGG